MEGLKGRGRWRSQSGGTCGEAKKGWGRRKGQGGRVGERTEHAEEPNWWVEGTKERARWRDHMGEVRRGEDVALIELLCCIHRLRVAVGPLQSPSAMWSSFTMYQLRPLCE